MTTIILAHGIARFDELLHLAGISGVYFNGIADHLRANGIPQVHETSVAFADSVGVRASELAEQVRNLPRPVHVIAHSMGGLDARHMIVKDRSLVRSLTTIGTPHNGTSFADFGIANGGHALVQAVQRASWPSLEGFRDLTTAACRVFNDGARKEETSNGVKYRVVSASEHPLKVILPLQPSWTIIAKEEGENDGLVSVASQEWRGSGLGKVERIGFPVPADHLNEVGWWDPAEGFFPSHYTDQIKDFYLRLAQHAIEQG